MRQIELAGSGAVDAGTIAAEQGVGGKNLGEQATDRGQVNLRDDGIEVMPFPVFHSPSRPPPEVGISTPMPASQAIAPYTAVVSFSPRSEKPWTIC